VEQPGFWSVVENRRSVRQFSERAIERHLLEKVIETGSLAPNAHNRQSWRFLILTKKDLMLKLADEMGVDFRSALINGGASPEEAQGRLEKRRERLTAAPAVVILCVDTAVLDQYSSQHRSDGEYLMAVQSAALAGGHMLLAAQALGFAGVWMCAPLFAPERVKAVLNLPETWLAQGMLLIGYPAQEPRVGQRKRMEEVSRWYE